MNQPTVKSPTPHREALLELGAGLAEIHRAHPSGEPLSEAEKQNIKTLVNGYRDQKELGKLAGKYTLQPASKELIHH